jgi:hypothetical protein
MELAIPLVALGGLFIISNQNKNKPAENFNNANLPDLPDVNYPEPVFNISNDTEATSNLSVNNRYAPQTAYTDKYFNQKLNVENLNYGVNKDDRNKMYKSLTGETVDRNNFKHNNMTPYFGGHIRSAPTDNNVETILDAYSGAGSQFVSKKEQAPLFKPGVDHSYGTGAPNSNDFYQSRVNPSMSMANVKPFESEQVGPGIGLGYTTSGEGGFNSGLMSREQWTGKNVDQLRVDTNPKISHSLFGLEGPAINKVKNMGSIGKMEKNHVNTDFEWNADRLFTTVGNATKPTNRANILMKEENRSTTSCDYTGAASIKNNELITGEYMPSKHNDLHSYPITPAGATNRGFQTEEYNGVKSNRAYGNNRTVTNDQNKDGYFGGMGGGIKEAIAPILDILRPSRKENTINSMRQYNNPRGSVGGTYMYDPTNTPAPTIREMTGQSPFHLNVNRTQKHGAYEVTKPNLNKTNRTETSVYYQGGSSASGAKGMTNAYTTHETQRNNDIKSSTIDSRTGNGGMALLNSEINMRTNNRDNMLQNNRAVSGANIISSIPSVNNMGKLNGGNNLYQNIQTDRTNPDILSGFQGNPFVIPMNAIDKNSYNR